MTVQNSSGEGSPFLLEYLFFADYFHSHNVIPTEKSSKSHLKNKKKIGAKARKRKTHLPQPSFCVSAKVDHEYRVYKELTIDAPNKNHI